MMPTTTRIDVAEAHRRFGGLARIRGGVTTWIEVDSPEGKWRPVFRGIWELVGYELVPPDPFAPRALTRR